jgi:hypothetical protein
VVYFMVIWYFRFCYVVPRKIWQPCCYFILTGTFAVISILVSKPVLENCDSAHRNETRSVLLHNFN